MDDKDRLDEAKGAEDALRPTLPGGEPVREGESGEAAGEADAAGTVDRPIQPGATQPGETMEQAQLRGGPVDITPERPRRG